MQRLGSAGVIADNGQRNSSFCRFALSCCVQQQARFRLPVPIDDYDLKKLVGNSFYGFDGSGAGFSLNAETRQNLANDRSRSLIGGKQEAAKSHALKE